MKKTLLLLLTSIAGFAQTLDPTFDTDGIATFQVSNTPSTQIAYDAALQTDGKIVYVGKMTSPNNSAFISRFNTDGSRDYTFNQYGFKLVTNSSQCVQIQNDGKIVVAGFSTITRVLTTGNLDLTFNNSGSKAISFNSQSMNIKCIRFQTDDKIIVSGYISNGSNNDFAIARLNSNGTLDTSFDTDGILILPIGTSNEQAYSHRIQADGKIIVFGEIYNGTNYDFAIVRINSNGTLDTSFGTNGKVTTPFTSSSNDRCFDGGILSDGKIVAFGNSDGFFSFTRYTITGTLDTTLDLDGKLTLSQPITTPTAISSSTLHSLPRLKILNNDKIVVSGTSSTDYKVIKLLVGGSSYDNSFDMDGVVTINDNTDFSTFLLEKTDGKLVTGGYSYDISLLNYKIRQIELNTDGSTSSNAIKNLYLSYDLPPFYGSTIQLSDNSYIVSCKSYIDYQNKLILKKILPDGSIDLSFGTSGYIDLGLGFFSKTGKLLLLSDGKIIISKDASLYKINSNGILDTTFGNSGVIDLSTIGNSELTLIDDVIISNDNKILIASDYSINSNTSTAIVKLSLDGIIDSSFGVNGIVNYEFISNPNEFPTSIYQDLDSKILVTSGQYPMTTPGIFKNLCIAKLNPNGTFDSSFSTNGKYIYQHNQNLDVDSPIIRNSLDNNYLISFDDSFKSYTLKVNLNGGIFNSFGTNGITETSTNSIYNPIIVESSGKILKGGQKDNQFSIIRYNSDGNLDTSFGSNGEINTSIEYFSGINNILLQTDGKLVATGYSFDGDRQKLTLVRFGDLNLGTIDLSSPKNSLLVYPNPIEKEATFQYTLNNNETVSIELLDIQGRVLQNIITNENQSAGLQSVRISLNENIASGNYFLKIASSKGSQSVQVIKK